jgi:hypothetical protein
MSLFIEKKIIDDTQIQFSLHLNVNALQFFVMC